MPAKEKDIQNAILAYLSIRKIFAWPVQTQGQYDPSKKIYRRPPKFFVYGVPDIEAALPGGVTVRIEVKSSVGRQSPHQILFEKRMKELGHHYLVARSVREVDDYLNATGLMAQRRMLVEALDLKPTLPPEVQRQ